MVFFRTPPARLGGGWSIGWCRTIICAT